MNVAIIFAGGTGQRMNTKTKPKQFLELHGKPILVYTIEKFNNHPEIDGIILVILKEWISYSKELVRKFRLTKVKSIIAGGETAFESQRRGLLKAAKLFDNNSIVLIHDGVRPLVDDITISKNIESVKTHRTAITATPAIETITIKTETGEVGQIIDRSKVKMAKAPQSFILSDIIEAHNKSIKDGLTFIDSASMMQYYGHKLYTVEGSPENIKITTPNDFYTFRALVDAKENSQIFGV